MATLNWALWPILVGFLLLWLVNGLELDDQIPWLGHLWPWKNALEPITVLLGLVIAAVGAKVAEHRAGYPANRLASSTSFESKNRTNLLKKIRYEWITGVLDPSLQHVIRLELGLEYRPDSIVRRRGYPERLLASPTDITRVFDDLGRAVLILGEPGAGKTTLLLELARDLLDRAEHDPSLPMPVVFNLSSWAEERCSLDEWLTSELHQRYGVSRALSQFWVNESQVLPLLDGLDEVAAKYRDACVDAINSWWANHGIVGLVVCSRIGDYDSLTRQLRMTGAVMIQALTLERVIATLQRGGERLAGLRAALRTNSELRELPTTPLMLSIMMLVYQGRPATASRVESDKAESAERRLWAAYVDEMLIRRTADLHYGHDMVLHWLVWLAKGMKQHGQSVLLIERLQPDWLPDEPAFRRYRGAIHLLYGVVVGLIVGLVFNLVNGAIYGVYGGVIGILIYSLVDGAAYGLVSGVLGGLVVGLIEGAINGPTYGLLSGLGSALVYGLVVGLVGRPTNILTIQPTEAWRWSFTDAFQQIKRGLKTSLVIGSIFGLVSGLLLGLGSGLFGPALAGLIVGLTVGLVGGLLYNFASGGIQAREVEQRSSPNQGIWLSGQSGLVSGLVGGLGIGLVLGLASGVGEGLVGCLIVGLGVGLAKGGHAFVHHFVLRYILWRTGVMPWNWTRFLDYAAERLLLRKVGGGYTFIHRSLLEYLSSLDS